MEQNHTFHFRNTVITKPHRFKEKGKNLTPTLTVTLFLFLTAVSGIFSNKNAYFFLFCETEKAYNSVKCNVQV